MNESISKSAKWGTIKQKRTDKQKQFELNYEARKKGSLKRSRSDKQKHLELSYGTRKNCTPKQIKSINIDAVNIEKLAHYAESMDLSQSRIVNLALNEFFIKQELLRKSNDADI